MSAWTAGRDKPVYVKPQPGQSNPYASTSLVLGIIGLIIVLFSFGIGFGLALLFSCGGWITGVLGRKQVTSGATTAGYGIARAGVIIGIVGIVLGVIAAIVWITLGSMGYDAEDFFRDLERLTERAAEGR